jgi:hypothetical protein
MNQSTPTQKVKTTNNQTLRLPMGLYERIAELALREDTSMNSMIIRLINLGLGHQANFDKAVRDFVFRVVTKEEVDRLADPS